MTTVALILWPFVALILFRVMSLPGALTATIVGGYLFLPEASFLKIPGLPALDKTSIPVLAALLLAPFAQARQPVAGPAGFFPRSFWPAVLIVLMFLGALGTVVTNGAPIPFQDRMLPGLPISGLMTQPIEIVFMLLPLFLARKYLADDEAMTKALKVFVGLALIYSLLALFEIRMSPQLNNWVYGFFPHSFAQHVRAGGFRPTVFLNHGLWLASFLALAILAAIGLVKMMPKEQKAFYILAALWLFMTLVLAKSLGALIIVILLAGCWIMLQRRIVLILAIFVGLAVTYPVLRSQALVPVDGAVALASRIDANRAGSLEYRFDHEAALLSHALEKPLFGWGKFGRNRATTSDGRWAAVPDGRWVITFGVSGYVGYISEFGLLAIGILALFFARRRAPSTVTIAVAVMLTANMIDLMPNATLTVLTWFLAGALIGRMEYQSKPKVDVETASDRPLTYARAQAQHSVYRRSFEQQK